MCASSCGEEYAGVIINGFAISSAKQSDSCILLKNKKIMIVKHILEMRNEDIILLCHEVVCNGDYFTNPCQSSVVSMFSIGCKEELVVEEKIENVLTKCIISWVHKVAIAVIPELE